MQSLKLAGAGVLTLVPNGNTLSDKPLYFESFEGSGPEISRYLIAGSFDGGSTRFSLRIEHVGSYWHLEIRRPGRLARQVRWSDNYRPIHFSNIAISKRSEERGDDAIIISVPYGEPQAACFANGDEVFQRILLVVDGSRDISAIRTTFTDCAPVHTPLEL